MWSEAKSQCGGEIVMRVELRTSSDLKDAIAATNRPFVPRRPGKANSGRPGINAGFDGVIAIDSPKTNCTQDCGGESWRKEIPSVGQRGVEIPEHILVYSPSSLVLETKAQV